MVPGYHFCQPLSLQTGVMLVPGRAGLLGACSLQHGPKRRCVEENVSFCLRNEKFHFFFFSALIFTF